VGMARDSDPDSGSCQFFIALESLPRLDGRYTIFGELIEGLEVARKIAELPRDLTDNPLEKVPMKITLKLSKVPGYLNSLQKGEDTSEREVLTGPGKPRPWDPGSSRWTSPALIRFPDTPLGTEAWPAVPLDLAVDAEGRVLDVRFGRLEVPQAAAILQSAGSWRFRAARYDGQPVKSRFSMDSRGGGPGPSQAPGTPRQIEGPVREPSALVVVPLPPNVAPPAVEPLLRLTVDEAGHVSDVELQVSCGVAALDEAAMEAARRMEFKPALDGQKPVPVYLNLSARFVKAPAP
jgi:TonB family protein